MLQTCNIQKSINWHLFHFKANSSETPVAKNCPSKSVELAVWLKKAPKSATKKPSPLSLMYLKKFVTWTLKKLANSKPNWCPNWNPLTNVPSFPEKSVTWNSLNLKKSKNHWRPNGAWILLLLPLVSISCFHFSWFIPQIMPNISFYLFRWNLRWKRSSRWTPRHWNPIGPRCPPRIRSPCPWNLQWTSIWIRSWQTRPSIQTTSPSWKLLNIMSLLFKQRRNLFIAIYYLSLTNWWENH